MIPAEGLTADAPAGRAGPVVSFAGAAASMQRVVNALGQFL